MELYATLRALIDANINTNGTQAITGAIHNDVMNQLLDALSVSEVYANPTLAYDPGTPETPVAYIALPGVYPSFGGLEITAPLGILIWNGSPAAWSVVQLSFPSAYEYRRCKTTSALDAASTYTTVAIEAITGGWVGKAGQWVQLIDRRSGEYELVQLTADLAADDVSMSFKSITMSVDIGVDSIVELDPQVNMKWEGRAIFGDGVNAYVDMPTNWKPPPVECTDDHVWVSLLEVVCNGMRMFWDATPTGPLEFNLHSTNRYRILLDWIPTSNDRFDVKLFQPRILA